MTLSLELMAAYVLSGFVIGAIFVRWYFDDLIEKDYDNDNDEKNQ